MRQVLLAILLLPLFAGIAVAVNPDEVLDNPALEQRARAISGELRCLVCQNQSIDDSDADLARDLRLLVRERLTEGDTDQQVLDFIVARYGEYVLLNPVVAWHTIVLWGAVPIVLIGAILMLFMRGRNLGSVSTGQKKLTKQEQDAVDSLR